MKKAIGIAVALLILAGMTLLLVGNRKKMKEQISSAFTAEQEVPVYTDTVAEQTYSHDFTSNGLCQAVSELNFVSNVSGRVVELYVDKGRVVRKGDPLLKIDSDLLESDYQASLAACEALRNDVQRFERSNLAGGVTDQQLENIRTQLVAAESRLARSRKMLEDAVVRSPMAGTVNARYVELGSLIAPNVPLFDIVNDGALKVMCNVSESKVKMLSKGMQVSLTSGTVPGKRFTGHVSHIGIKTDRGLNYPVEVLLDKDSDLRIGMYLKVLFDSGSQRAGILIPRKAIIGSAKAANVYRIRDGIARQQEVSLGDMIGDEVEILTGLSAGDVIITSGIMNVADGMAVKPINP